MTLAVEIRDLTKDYELGFWRKPSARAGWPFPSSESGEIFGFLGAHGEGKRRPETL